MTWNDEPDAAADGDAEGELLCVNCHEPLYEDAEQCPHCHHYVTDEDEELNVANEEEASYYRRKPWWIIVGALLCLYLALRGMFF